MSNDLGKKKSRGRAYPGHPLAQAVDFLERVYSQLGDGPFSRNAIADAMGQRLSGSAMVKIGALTHFGLLVQRSGVYEVSDLGHSILYPRTSDERTESLATAARNPSLYLELFNRYEGKALPKLLSNILMRELGVASKSAEKCADLFRESVEFAGLLNNGILLDNPNSITDSPNHGSSATPMSMIDRDLPPHIASSKPLNLEGDRVFSMPLSGRRVVSLAVPESLSATDLAVVRRWIDLMEETLVESSTVTSDEADLRGIPQLPR